MIEIYTITDISNPVLFPYDTHLYAVQRIEKFPLCLKQRCWVMFKKYWFKTKWGMNNLTVIL